MIAIGQKSPPPAGKPLVADRGFVLHQINGLRKQLFAVPKDSAEAIRIKNQMDNIMKRNGLIYTDFGA